MCAACAKWTGKRGRCLDDEENRHGDRFENVRLWPGNDAWEIFLSGRWTDTRTPLIDDACCFSSRSTVLYLVSSYLFFFVKIVHIESFWLILCSLQFSILLFLIIRIGTKYINSSIQNLQFHGLLFPIPCTH